MKIVKKIFAGILAILMLILIVGIFVKKDYSVMREVTINKPKQQVFDYIKLLKNQDNFSKWASMDPNTKKEYRGTDGTVGFVSAWDSQDKHLGQGEQEIKSISEGQRIDYELRFMKPFKSMSQAYMSTEAAAPDQTTVQWGFQGKMNYPMNVMLLFMDMDKMMGPDLQTGLDNLKTVLEKQ